MVTRRSFDKHNLENNELGIAEICYQEIDQSNIIIIVIPFGLSVASEIGYAIHQKRLGLEKILIVYFSGLGNTKEEIMIDPYIDYQTDSLEDLLDLVGQLVNKKKSS